MRIWRDPSGSLVDDQRPLAYVASHGSLSAALESGDFVLVADSGEAKRDSSETPRATRSGSKPRVSRHLADYL